MRSSVRPGAGEVARPPLRPRAPAQNMRRPDCSLSPPHPVRRRSLLYALLPLVAVGLPALAQSPALRADSTPTLLLPARVFDGTDMHDGWGVLVRGERIVAAGPASRDRLACRNAARRARRHHADARADRGALAPAAAPVQRDGVGRPGAARAAGAARRPRHQSRARHAARRLHHYARPRHRGRRATPTSGSSRPSTRGSSRARGCSSSRAPSSPRAATDRAASRRRWTSRRARRRPTARPRCRAWCATRSARRGLDQGVRGLPLGPQRRDAPDLHAGRAEADRRDREHAPDGRSRPTRRPRRGCAARSSPASRRSSTATTGRRRSSGMMKERGVALCPTRRRRRRDSPLPRLEAGRSRAAAHSRQAGELQGGAGGGRHDRATAATSACSRTARTGASWS